MRATRFKRIILAFLASLLAVVGGIVAMAPPAQAYVGTPVLFFTPHQDDEALFMGAGIKHHVLAGRKVYVILLTDGGASGMCIPTYGSRAACVAARDQEFINGVTSMGAIPVIRPDRIMDGSGFVAMRTYATTIVQTYYRNGTTYRNASYKTMSETDVHPDHAGLGAGLRAAVGPTDKRWYVKPEDTAGHAVTTEGKYNLNATLDCYPFGKTSVPAYFTQATYPTGIFSRYYA